VSEPDGGGQRARILDIALRLMSQRGVDGTSMRDLANACDLNVATLYHYFASKRELLVAVLEERGLVEGISPLTSGATIARDQMSSLRAMLDDILGSMLEVEEFVRLMLGEVLRGEDTAKSVGDELFVATQAALESWVNEFDPTLCADPGAPAVARVVRAFLVGLFFEYVAGVLGDGDPKSAFSDRAAEFVALLSAQRAR
jgi:AcrR family transcriptional regulator